MSNVDRGMSVAFQIHGGAMIKKTRGPGKPTHPVTTTRVDPICMALARAECRGDLGRLQVCDEGKSVIVWNSEVHRQAMTAK